MGDCAVFYDEIRFSVRNPDITEMWVFVRGEGDCPFQVLGWHYKAFPSSVTTIEILTAWLAGDENPMTWMRRDPPPTLHNYEPDLEALEALLVKRMGLVKRGDDTP